MVYIFIAQGFEIIEAMAPIDMLRRAQIDVKTVGVGAKIVTSSCGIPIVCDITDEQFTLKNVDAIVLPGGMPGTLNLEKSPIVQNAINMAVDEGCLICAICAAPSILGNIGILDGKVAICYPGYEAKLKGAILSKKDVVTDGNIITAKGAGVSVEFGLEIVKTIKDNETANKIKEAIQCR